VGGPVPDAKFMTRILLDREIEAPSSIRLEGAELHYLTRVRRRREGDTVELRSASGRCFSATVSVVEQDSAQLLVEREIDAGVRTLPVRLLVSIPKHRLLDDVIRMAGELGVERLCPVIAARTAVTPKGDKIHRWRRIAEESLRQCGRTAPIAIEEVRPLFRALEEEDGSCTKLIFHPAGDARLITDAAPFRPPVTALIGPEGGFTDEEKNLAAAAGFLPVRLDTPILRIETAAVAAAVLTGALIAQPSKRS
jgi:16S rRNA (uracil1498-N3)-methyltransferase